MYLEVSQLLVLLLLALLIVFNHEGRMVQLTPQLAQLVKDNAQPFLLPLLLSPPSLPSFSPLHLAKLHRDIL